MLNLLSHLQVVGLAFCIVGLTLFYMHRLPGRHFGSIGYVLVSVALGLDGISLSIVAIMGLLFRIQSKPQMVLVSTCNFSLIRFYVILPTTFYLFISTSSTVCGWRSCSILRHAGFIDNSTPGRPWFAQQRLYGNVRVSSGCEKRRFNRA